jgi:HK97 family phage major capsid protein/HK97 family phage prohead protease
MAVVRAYSVLQIKSVDEDQRVIEGIASTPSTDRMGDIVEPKGATFSLPIPLLWQHKSSEPIGHVIEAAVTESGIAIRAQIAKIADAGKLKDRLDEAWQSIKNGLVRGLSIGFNPIEAADIKGTWGQRFTKWEWLELSAVTIPANIDASIQTVKSYDTDSPAAAGTGGSASKKHSPGATGRHRVVSTREHSPMKKTISQQIAEFEATRAAKSARMDEILEASSEKGETLDAEQTEEYDGLDAEVKTIDAHLTRLRAAEKRAAEGAKRVIADDTQKASDSRDPGRVLVMARKEEPGIRFARLAKCVAVGRGSISDAMLYAKEHYSGDEALIQSIKTAVAGGTTANGQAPLLQYTDILTEFVDYLRPLTILGKFGGPIPGAQGNYPSMTRVPFNVRVGSQTAGGSGSWVGEGKPTPLTKGTFSTVTLDMAKVAAISVITKEEARFPSISADMKVRNDLAAALIQAIDTALVDPSNAGSAGVKPASLTYNVAATAASGTTAAAFAVDIKTAIAVMLASGIQAGSLVALMSQQIALALSLMRTSLGVRNFPDLTMRGGFVEGIPVIVSEVLTGVGSPSTPSVVFVNAQDVFLADDGVVDLESSDQASLEMSDAPTQDGTTGGGASMVSLWQTDMLGIKATRPVNWKLARAASVQYISGAAYTPQ